MNKEKNFDEENMEEIIRDLVITRINAQMSPNLKLSIGENGSLDINQMIEHVKQGDSIGQQIIQAHMNFIKAQASGALTSALNSVE